VVKKKQFNCLQQVAAKLSADINKEIMSIREEYQKETGKYYYTESMDFEWSDDYVEWLEARAEQALSLGGVSTRYFFICTIGKNPNGTINFNNFDIQTIDGYPSFKRCIELSNDKFPNMREVNLISISEMSAEDWEVFVSNQ